MHLSQCQKKTDLRYLSETPTHMQPGHVPVVIFLCAGSAHSFWLDAGLTCTPRTPFFKRKIPREVVLFSLLAEHVDMVQFSMLLNPRADYHGPVGFRAEHWFSWRNITRSCSLHQQLNWPLWRHLRSLLWWLPFWHMGAEKKTESSLWIAEMSKVLVVCPNPFQTAQTLQVQLGGDTNRLQWPPESYRLHCCCVYG